jgi:hypothetical protein
VALFGKGLADGNRVLFVVVDDAFVPVFHGREQGVSAVMVIGLVGAERDIIAELFEILFYEAFQAIFVEDVPFFQILESFAFVFDDQAGMGCGKRIPDFDDLVRIAFISVFYGIFDDFTYLLFQEIDFLDFRRRFLNDQKGKISDLAEIAGKFFVKHAGFIK